MMSIISPVSGSGVVPHMTTFSPPGVTSDISSVCLSLEPRISSALAWSPKSGAKGPPRTFFLFRPRSKAAWFRYVTPPSGPLINIASPALSKNLCSRSRARRASLSLAKSRRLARSSLSVKRILANAAAAWWHITVRVRASSGPKASRSGLASSMAPKISPPAARGKESMLRVLLGRTSGKGSPPSSSGFPTISSRSSARARPTLPLSRGMISFRFSFSTGLGPCQSCLNTAWGASPSVSGSESMRQTKSAVSSEMTTSTSFTESSFKPPEERSTSDTRRMSPSSSKVASYFFWAFWAVR